MDRAKIEDVIISVVSSERPRHSAETTDKPVEKGQDISDHTKINPPTLNLIGAVIGEDAGDNLLKLKKYQEDSTLVKYIHRTAYGNMIITEIATTHEAKIRNGFEFNITLKHIRIANAKEVEIKVAKTSSQKTKSQVKTKSNAGTKQTKKTYSSNTNVSEVQSDNEIVISQSLQDIRTGNTAKALVDLYLMKPKRTVPEGIEIE